MNFRVDNYVRRFSRPAALFIFLFFINGCGMFKIVRVPIPVPVFGLGGKEKTETAADRKVQSGGEAIGKATWYGPKFHGKSTASGERFDMYKLTAAHRTLPFGTKVRVTNLKNNKSVIVRVNDRGPWGNKNLIIDLSRAAARKIDSERDGVVPV